MATRRAANRAAGKPPGALYHMVSNERITFQSAAEATYFSYWQTMRKNDEGRYVTGRLRSFGGPPRTAEGWALADPLAQTHGVSRTKGARPAMNELFAGHRAHQRIDVDARGSYAYFVALIFQAWGMALLVGGGIVISLRVLGVAGGAPLQKFRGFFPVMWLGADAGHSFRLAAAGGLSRPRH